MDNNYNQNNQNQDYSQQPQPTPPAGDYNPYNQPDPGYQPPAYQPYYQPPKKNGKAVAGMVLGICALFFTVWYYPAILGLGLAIAGLVISSNARKEATPETGLGMAKAGFICSIIALALSTIFVISCVGCVGCASCAALSDYYYYY